MLQRVRLRVRLRVHLQLQDLQESDDASFLGVVVLPSLIPM